MRMRGGLISTLFTFMKGIAERIGSPSSLPPLSLIDAMMVDTRALTTFPSGVFALSKILLYLVVVLLIGALLSPPIYWAVQGLAEHGWLSGLSEHPFHRYFSRTTQVTALVLLVPLLLWLGIRHPSEFGLQRNPHRGRDLGAGLLIALVPLVILAWIYIAGDTYRFNKSHDFVKLLRILATAGFVAVVEEFLFRGVLLGLAARAIGRWPALVAVSAVFAFVHFLKPVKESVEVVHWNTGFHHLGAALSSFPEPQIFAWALASLFLGGLILGFATLQTRSLWLSIGIHAGWIFGQQGIQWLAKLRAKPSDAFLPWVGPNTVSGAVPTGLAPLLALLLTAVVVCLYLRYASSSRRAVESGGR